MAVWTAASSKLTVALAAVDYDVKMSDVFFEQLGIPAPDINLAVGSGSHAKQTAEIMVRFEPVVLERRSDLVFVYSDVNSTVTAALVPELGCVGSATSRPACARSIEPCPRRSIDS